MLRSTLWIIALTRCQISSSETLDILVANPSEIDRKSATVEIAWNALAAKLPSLSEEQFAVIDTTSKQSLSLQIVERDDTKTLVFQSDFTPSQTKRFQIDTDKTPPETVSPLFASFIAGREDFAWENDRIAFRVYGPQLQQWEESGNPAGLVSSGIDVWAKRASKPVIERWYRKDNDYHADNGEGLDFYSVGKSRGCGGLAVRENGQIYSSKNFVNYRILASGPVRLIFELDYAAWECGARTISETKRITMDAHQNFFRADSFIQTSDNQPVKALVGIAKRTETALSSKSNYLSAWENQPKDSAKLGCAIVIPGAATLDLTKDDKNNYVELEVQSGKPLSYYAGSGWTKANRFTTRASWDNYVSGFARATNEPLQIEIQNPAN